MFKNIKFLASLTSVTSAGGILAYASLTEDEKKKFASACNVSPFLSQTARAAEHDEMPYIPSRDDKHMDVRHWWSFRSAGAIHDHYDEKLPKEIAKITQAPEVPPPVNRSHPVHLIVDLASEVKTLPLSQTQKYEFWTFNGAMPGPFIRARVGDVLEVRHKNNDMSGMAHNIDFHAVTGPGGGGPALFAESGETKRGMFKLLNPGLYIYHCAAAPVPVHMANGMYGLMLVEPEKPLPPVDKEFYVMQSDIYAEKDDSREDRVLVHAYTKGLKEQPTHVVFNGREGALTDKPLMCKQGERVRLYFGNAGPNLVSSFHVIGAIFDKVYREGDLLSAPARNIQTTLVPSGGSTVVEIQTVVPGSLTLVDHSIFRIDKGAVGFLKVQGTDPRMDVYAAAEMPVNCPNCKLHA